MDEHDAKLAQENKYLKAVNAGLRAVILALHQEIGKHPEYNQAEDAFTPLFWEAYNTTLDTLEKQAQQGIARTGL